MRILLIEDNRRLAEAIAAGLGTEGFGVDVFLTGEEGRAAAQVLAYDAIVLDLGLPDRDGIEILRDLRKNADPTPILILTARDAVEDRVSGLDCGADDYMLKPFAMNELAARLRALLRRPGHALGLVLKIGNISFDTIQRQVVVEDQTVSMAPRELDVLELLMRRAGQVVTKRIIEDVVYGLSADVSPNTVEASISRLRRRLEGLEARVQLHTVRGVGYLLAE